MPNIKTSVDGAVYTALVAKRKKAGLPSISALFLQLAGVLTEDKAAAEIVRRALTIAKKKSTGSEFRLRDLFGARWESFSKSARLRAGRLFIAEIEKAVHGIRADRKSSSGQQIYVVA